MIKSLFILLVTFFSIHCFAQQAEEIPIRKSANYVGIQVNELIRQILNFGGSSSTITNPYLLTYAVNSVRTGIGLNVGLGYNYNQSNTGDAITPRKTTIHNFSLRAGIEKKFKLGPRWLSSYGMDFLIEDGGNLTETSFIQSGGPKVTTETTTSGVGLGPRFTINFMITNQIVIGTEASYYYKSLSITQTATSVPDVNNSAKSFNFSVPAVIFLIMKF